MEILWLIIAFVAHFFTAFVLMYCCDNAKLWKGYDEISLWQPSIGDLKNVTDKSLIDKYVTEVVCPSYSYFILKNEIKSLQEDDTDGCLSGLILQAFSFLFIIKCVAQVFPNNDLSRFLYNIIVIGGSLIVCFLGYYILSIIYDKYCSIKDCNLNTENLQKRFHYDEKEFDISERDAFNNFVICEHYYYLRCIEDSVRFRKSIKKIITGLAIIIYVLFFFSFPD